MKKTISLLLSIIMLLSIMPISALAYSKDSAPLINLGDTVNITAKYIPDKTVNEKEQLVAKFVPGEDGCYEFVFDEDISGDNMPYVGLYVENGSDIKHVTDIYYASDGVVSKMSFTADLKKDKAYYVYAYKFYTKTTNDYNGTLTVNKHTHQLKRRTFSAKVYKDEDAIVSDEGGIIDECTASCCSYLKIIETFPKVIDIKFGKTAYVYNGKAQKPAPIITLFDKKAPLSKEYYTVAYKNNKKVGTATAIIKFKGKYEGTLEKTFKIVPKGTSITKLSPKKKGFTVKYKKLKKNVSGYQIQYAKDSKFTKSAKKLTVKGNKASSKRIKGLKKGKYYVRVRTYKTVKGKKYYSSWSKAKSVKAK